MPRLVHDGKKVRLFVAADDAQLLTQHTVVSGSLNECLKTVSDLGLETPPAVAAQIRNAQKQVQLTALATLAASAESGEGIVSLLQIAEEVGALTDAQYNKLVDAAAKLGITGEQIQAECEKLGSVSVDVTDETRSARLETERVRLEAALENINARLDATNVRLEAKRLATERAAGGAVSDVTPTP